MDVLLVHGLGRTSVSMRRLGGDLARAGHRPAYFSYYAWAQRYDAIAERLARRVDVLRRSGAPFALIGHSLGGVLLRDALARGGGGAPAHLILLGAPSRSPRMARRALKVAPIRWFVGSCGAVLAAPDTYERLPHPPCPCLLIAGTRGLPGSHTPFGGEPNDGVVAVTEVALDGLPLATVPATHTFMMNHPETRRLIRRTLTA